MIDVRRKESMSPDGFLHVHVQNDGDAVVHVGGGDPDGGVDRFATVEFCTPFAGGGGSGRTWEALIRLALAMAEDNADPEQRGRRGADYGNEEALVRLRVMVAGFDAARKREARNHRRGGDA